MAERVTSLGDYVGIIRRRWRYPALILPAAILAAVYMAFSLPAMYQSSATILLEPSSIPPELVKTTVISYADQQIELVRRTVMTPDRLEPVAVELDPYPQFKQYSARDKARMIVGDTSIQKVDPITMQPMVISSAFSILYNNANPQTAAAITQRIADLFLNYNRTTRVAQAKQTYDFLQSQANEVNGQIRGLEQKISEFKTRYGDALPETRDRNESSLDRVQRDLDGTEAQIRVVAQQEALLKLQLSQVSPTIVASGTDAYTQLGQLRAELAAAKQKYTPDHPDVKRLTRSIEALAAQANLNTPVQTRPDNPEYLRVASELSAVQQNLAALRSASARARSQITDYDRRLSRTPTVERDYAELQRQYDMSQRQFGEIQTKLRSAETAQALETESQGERYTLIRAAFVPTKPFSPNRLGIILVGFIVGGGLAIGLAVIRESADPTVRSSKDFEGIAEVPLIGAVPLLRNHRELARERLIWGSVAGVYLLATVGVALTVLT